MADGKRNAPVLSGVAMEADIGVCIRCWDWSETSQTVWLFCRRLGLVRCVAKGAKRENAKFSGGFEPLTVGEVQVSMRKVERDAQALATLAEWNLQEVFPVVRRSLAAFYAGHAMLDIVQHGLTDGDPHTGVFDALLANARVIDGGGGDARAVLTFAWTVLYETGHAPELMQDVRRGGVIGAARTYAFAPRRGGLTRDDADMGAGEPAEPAGHEVVWRVRAETVEVLRQVAAGGVAPGADAASVVRAARLLLMHFREVFSCDPRAVRAWLDRTKD